MASLSTSFTLGKASVQHGANVEHNNRKFIAGNIKPEKMAENITYVRQDVEDAYHELFGEAIAAYNAKQKQPCRRIQDYYKHISDSKREEAYYEIIVQFGDSRSAPCGSQNGEEAKKMLDEYIRGFKERNPNLHIFNAVLHMDEASPHLHIDFIPFYTAGRKNGLSKGVSMKAALDEQGFTATNFKQNRLVAWEASEREEMERILHRHGYTRDDKNAKYAHQTVEQFKKTQDEKKIVAALRKSRQITDADLEVSHVQQLRTRLNLLEREHELFEQQQQSPYRSFFYAQPEKQAFVQSQLDDLGIPYHETENGFEAQECFVEEIRKIEKEYKPKRSAARDKLREDIDRLLMQSSSVEELLEKLKAENYTIRNGKYLAAKPPHGNQAIRLKSLGEHYSEYALRNRINARKKYESSIAQKISTAKKNTPEFVVLRTVQFYTIAFGNGALPMRKRDKTKPFSWTNDIELDKLTALNAKINAGATVESLRREMEELEQAVSEKEKQLEREKAELKTFYDLKEKIEIVFEGKKSDVFTLEQAQRTLQQYGTINASNYRNVDILINNQMESVQQADAALSEERKKLQEASDTLSAMEKVMGGTYVQSLVGAERERRESKFVPNGVKPV